jgi:hypothetical protein
VNKNWPEIFTLGLESGSELPWLIGHLDMQDLSDPVVAGLIRGFPELFSEEKIKGHPSSELKKRAEETNQSVAEACTEMGIPTKWFTNFLKVADYIPAARFIHPRMQPLGRLALFDQVQIFSENCVVVGMEEGPGWTCYEVAPAGCIDTAS